MKTYWKQAAIFVVAGLILYGAVYCTSEVLVYKYANRNRFYGVKTADFPSYDYLILGASHALPFSFEDMDNRLEEMTDARIINLSTPGGGIVVNSLLLDYFLAAGHNTKNVIYFIQENGTRIDSKMLNYSNERLLTLLLPSCYCPTAPTRT